MAEGFWPVLSESVAKHKSRRDFSDQYFPDWRYKSCTFYFLHLMGPFLKSYRCKHRGFSLWNVNVSPEGDAIIYRYMYNRKQIFLFECLNAFFQSICSKSILKCKSDQITSGGFYLFMQLVFHFTEVLLRLFSLMYSSKPCLNVFSLLSVKHHPVSRSVGVRRADHGEHEQFDIL